MENEKDAPPGPNGRFLIGNVIDFAEDPLGFLLTCSHQYGDVAKLSKRSYLVSCPDLVEKIFHNKDAFYEKVDTADTRNNNSAFPHSVMSSAGANWRTKRRSLQPAFHRRPVFGEVDHTCTITKNFLESWGADPGVCDMRQEMGRLCMLVGSRFLFGASVDVDDLRQITDMVDAIMSLTRSQIRFPAFFPTRGNLRLRRARRGLDATMDRIVEQHRAPSADRSCVLGILLRQDESGRSAWLRDELATMIMSGLEPMADALTWTFYLLALHVNAKEQIVGEVEALMKAQGSISGADLLRLPITAAAVKEALRLYPPAWTTGRIVMHDCRLGGFHIPAGTTLVVSQWVTHRDPRYFADPTEYRPERWLNKDFLAKLPRYAYFPFGGGARKCIGDHLAMSQLIIVVALVTQAFDLELAPNADVRPYPALVLRPLGVRMSIAPRWTPAGNQDRARSQSMRNLG